MKKSIAVLAAFLFAIAFMFLGMALAIALNSNNMVNEYNTGTIYYLVFITALIFGLILLAILARGQREVKTYDRATARNSN